MYFFEIKIQPNMSEHEKNLYDLHEKKFYDLLNAETKPKFLCRPYTKQRHFCYRKRAFLGKGGVEDRIETIRRLFNCSC